MKTKLLPTQVVDVQRLVAAADLPNFSMPGTGKTLTTIGGIEAMGMDNGIVIAPPIALPMWRDVLAEELGVTTKIINFPRADLRDYEDTDFLIFSYGQATKYLEEIRHRRGGRKRQALVLDEAQALKTPDSARTKAIFGPRCDGEFGLTEISDYCFLLTGTPIERYADDLWPQLRALHGDVLAQHGALTLEQFRSMFTHRTMKKFHPRQKPQLTTVGSKNEDMLHDLLYNAEDGIGAIRRTLADVEADMPAVTFRYVSVESKPSPEVGRIVNKLSLADIMQALIDGEAAMATARRAVGISKLKDIAEYVVSQAAHGNVLVGYIHTDFGKSLALALNMMGLRTERIGGDVSSDAREKIVAGFNSGEVRIIVGQIAAMGVSLNLQGNSRHVIVAEDDFSDAKITQFYNRVWRLGQKHHVQVDFCVSDNPIDEALMAIRTNKALSSGKVHNFDKENSES